MKLGYEKLDIYHAAIDFVLASESIIKALPKGRSYLSDQLQRAATSILLNIAEDQVNIAQKKKHVFTELLYVLQQNLLLF